jgi:hypothetical protein
MAVDASRTPGLAPADLGCVSRSVRERQPGGCGRDSPSVGSGRFVHAAPGCPPRRSQRAGLPHWAPALGDSGESLLGPGMQNPR